MPPLLSNNRFCCLTPLAQRTKKEFNIVFLHPDDAACEPWTAENNVDKIKAHFLGWEPRCVHPLPDHPRDTARSYPISVLLHRIQKLLSLIPSALRWKLMDRDPLSTWIHKDGKLVLLGDSCHPMLVRMERCSSLRHVHDVFHFTQPYRAQGSAMAVSAHFPFPSRPN